MKKRLIRLGAGAVLFAAAAAAGALNALDDPVLKAAAFLIPYILVGYKVILKAVRNIFNGKVFDENFLMAVASIGAFFVGEYPEAVAVMLFYQVGELFEDYAVGKSRKSIAELMNIRPDYANLKTADGTTRVSPEQVKVGEIIVVRPGEKVPLDGVVVSGNSSVDTAALTGESMPRDVGAGNEILSGCINLSGLIEVKTEKEFGESTVSRILELVENASSQKAKTENFITRFAAVYTPAVVGAAVILAVVPPLVIPGASFADWIYRALNFLVVSCPCALVISVPLGFFGGIGAASRIGVLVKGSNYLEAAAYTELVVMDKTGTLTKGIFEVEKVQPAEGFRPAVNSREREKELITLAALAESNSTHPISQSVCRAAEAKYGITLKDGRISDHVAEVAEIAGQGVSAIIDGCKVLAGNDKLMKSQGIDFTQSNDAGTVVYIAADGEYAGCILIADQPKEDAAETVKGLKARGITTVMLTGDSKTAGESVGKKLGIDRIYSELLPEDKVNRVCDLLAEKSEKGRLIFVGDGINDAPVLARADLGVAMGGLGSDAAIEAADIVIMDDKPSKLLDLMKISRRTLSIVRQNIVFALGVKLAVLILSALGLCGMWAAVFADVGVSVIAILNSMRALKIK